MKLTRNEFPHKTSLPMKRVYLQNEFPYKTESPTHSEKLNPPFCDSYF